MIRTTLAAVALAALFASASFAGDCGCGSGGSAPAWDGYCGCGGGGCNACCPRPCFPLLSCALNKVGRVVDAILPDPCCRRGTGCFCGGPVGCAAPTCAAPSCGAPGCCTSAASPGDNPFIDDYPASPMPMKDARFHSTWNSPVTRTAQRPVPAPRTPSRTTAAPQVAPKATAKAMPVKMATQAKPASSTKSRSVLKVAYEEEVEDFDAPPAAPASIEVVQEEVQPEVRVVAKPVFRARPATSDAPVNPLR